LLPESSQFRQHQVLKKQFNLANVLVVELKTIGMTEVTIDEHGLCYGFGQCSHMVPTIGFVSHSVQILQEKM
jgi:di/tripeptidase